MTTITVKHKDQDHTAVMNLNVVRNYSRKKGYKTLNEFSQSFNDFGNEEDMSFDKLDDFALLFLCAFQEGARIAGKENKLTIDDVFMLLTDEREALMSIVAESLNTTSGEEDGNPQPPKAKK